MATKSIKAGFVFASLIGIATAAYAGPLSIDFQARDYANILRPGGLSLKTFNLSTGFSISH